VIELLHIDCMEYMRGLPDKAFELAIVDPPYGIGADKGCGQKEGFDKRDGKKIIRAAYTSEWDNARPSENYFNELSRITRNQIIWGGNFFADLLSPATHWIFWDKKNPMPTFGDGELAYTSIKRKSITRIEMPYWGHQSCGEVERIHPTQKPVKLYEWLLTNYAKKGDRILDTHLGSGSSAIAAHNLGFDFLGCELDRDYYDSAVKRFNAHAAQQSLFTAPEIVNAQQEVLL
jgi:site-specific DNA-methyltransferase (adenine-specific)